ncbi:hypothetical protein I5V28_16150 [Stenotrophomonas maltophilia]|uniref:hypothetical protein n=1 Tax=Stenotrophomonas maltophilia group sp. Smal32 TaxID=3377164 RepID=UPI0018D2E774|nr:hypothetical protein [Stenotrophomonas maltophilia]MBH1747349.1 hypothetical protein [Stenotrophomonas maltophilia]
MASITATSRGAARVESRPHAGTVVVQVGDALVSLSPFEARKVAEYLILQADLIDQRASIDRSNPQAAAA